MVEILLDRIINYRYAGTICDYTQDHWSSDWNGDEVGYDDVLIVGLYRMRDGNVDYYVDTETGIILEAWYAPNDLP